MRKLYLSSVFIAGLGLIPLGSIQSKTQEDWEDGNISDGEDEDLSEKIANIERIRDKLLPKIQRSVYQAVIKNAQNTNATLQSSLKNIEEQCRERFRDLLGAGGLANADDDANKAIFAQLWALGINSVYNVIDNGVDLADTQLVSETTSDGATQDLQIDSRSFKRKTTLLNILMRIENAIELPEKVQTLFENGCDKNLHSIFEDSSDMASQTEYPLAIALFELKSDVRERVLQVFFKDKIQYGWNKYLEGSKYKIKNTIESVEKNKKHILEKLIENRDFSVFSMVLNYIEENVKYIVESYNRGFDQISDQVYSPILEKVLEKMMLVRRKCIVNKEKNKPLPTIDFIHEFYTSEELAPYMSMNHDARFNLDFQNTISVAFQEKFDALKDFVDSTRSEAQVRGEEVQGLIKDWAVWANFRNRIARHLNKFALKASNSGSCSNVIRLVRYTNIYNRVNIKKAEDIDTNRQEMFKELYEVGGSDIIYKSANDLGWTPAHFAMFNREFEDIQLYLIQSPQEITKVDGVLNNILHLAFPQPKSIFERNQNNKEEGQDPLDNIGTNIGQKGMKENTTNAIISILGEESIPKKDKIDALKQKSGRKFTPVSLAAAMGYYEVFNYMKDFLNVEHEWDAEQHSVLGKSIGDILRIGMENFKASAEEHNNGLKIEEQKAIDALIKAQTEKQEAHFKNAIQEVYDTERPESLRIMRAILDPARKKIEAYFKLDPSERKKDPYPEALAAGIEAMLTPYASEDDMLEQENMEYFERKKELAKKKVEDRKKRAAEAKRLAEEEKKKNSGLFKKISRLFGRSKKEKPAFSEVFAYEEVEDIEDIKRPAKRAPNPLKGMLEANNRVKISYLKSLVEYVLNSYLHNQTALDKIKASIAYKAITGIDNLYFKSHFNYTVEESMKDFIRTFLEKVGRLEEENIYNDKRDNAFDMAKKSANSAFKEQLKKKKEIKTVAVKEEDSGNWE